jgi:hypothetical protein
MFIGLRVIRDTAAVAVVAVLASAPAWAEELCAAATGTALLPESQAACDALWEDVRDPSALPLNEYEAKLGEFFEKFCHRGAGWARDKHLRDTGPYTQHIADGKWVGQYHGTHAPVVIYYSPDFMEWLRDNRPLDADGEPVTPKETYPIPDGALVAKEMFPAPAARCGDHPVEELLPTSGIAFYVRDGDASHDGWFWGWYGYSGWAPDWPPGPDNGAPLQGFGQYCVNCHASAEDHLSFASLKNIEGEPGDPLVFLSQDWDLAPPPTPHHRLVVLPDDPAPRLGQPFNAYDDDFLTTYGDAVTDKPTWDTVDRFPSATYDNVWAQAGGQTAASEFLTSDQCAGCHDAGGTGLQFSMTEINTDAASAYHEKLINYSPYGTWRTSPMGLAGRDPIFFAQLASETQTFHTGKGTKDPIKGVELSGLIENVCLGCHGIMGQRQFEIDARNATGTCATFTRDMVAATPFPTGTEAAQHANYGALARDGISCAACHRMVQTDADIEAARNQPENACIEERQDLLNPASLGLSGFARTFTGSYFVGDPEILRGPFPEPLEKPMLHSLGIKPVHDDNFATSELCGTCHTVHLPVLNDGAVIGYTYEQTTYPEWLFSAYRTGTSPNGDLPLGAGDRAASCLDCHMINKDPDGEPFVDKIASIQEYSNFPEAEYNLGPKDIDVKEREGFARHTLVGLNVFLTKMAQQFPDVFGIPTMDPMLTSKGEPSLVRTEQEMLINADGFVADVKVMDVGKSSDTLTATVRIDSKVGHKFPSGVGFRRAILTFEVMDALGNALWTSGGMNGSGVILGADGQPIPGELWWEDDCSARLSPGKPQFQPHHQTITSRDQVQIYQELVVSPAPGGDPMCGDDPAPGGDLTTSFLSICGEVKDNRLLPHGYLRLEDRIKLAEAIGATERLAREATAHHVDGDPDYVDGGGDTLTYEIPLSDIPGTPVTVKATLSYQATPPFYLQDRFCTAEGPDRDRLYFLAGHLNLDGTEANGWAFELVDSGKVTIPD